MRALQLGQALDLHNRLAFPVGRKPGINLSHIAFAAGQCQLAAVARGANFIDLLSGKFGTPNLSPTSVIDSIGPCVDFAETQSQLVNFSGKSTATIGALTVAVIFRFSSNNNNLDTVTVDTNNNYALFMDGDQFGMSGGPGNFFFGTLSPAINTPYLIIMSADASSWVGVMKNLHTGQISLGGAASGIGTSATGMSGTWSVGGVVGTRAPYPGNYAAAAIFTGPSRLSQAQELQWAADPWSFWYPRREAAFVGAAAAGFKPYWAANANTFIEGAA